MKVISRTLAVVLILVATVVYEAPQAQASGWRTTTRYYDAFCSYIGFRIVNCNNQVTSGDSQTGVWKEVQYDECLGEGQVIEYYHNCGGQWIQVGYLGDPSC